MFTITELGPQLWLYILPSILFILTALVIIGVVVYKRAKKEYGKYSDEGEWGMITAIMTGVLAVFLFVPLLVSAIPFQAKYYPLYSVSGTVASVSNVFTETSGEFTSEPVVLFEGSDIPFVVDDSRITALEGREVELLCMLGWQYQAADYWTCSIRDGGY